MQASAAVPVLKDLVLIGGGHSHVAVLRNFGMKPIPGVRMTLITRDLHTPYSGMLPGYVSGIYTYDECHIDLARLAVFAKARIIHAAANGIDIKNKRVQLPGRPPIPYDVLSIDIGITPGRSMVPGAAEYTTPVKPIDEFFARFDVTLKRAQEGDRAVHVAVVGGGAGGTELALAVHDRLQRDRAARGFEANTFGSVTLFCSGQLLPSYPASVRRSLQKVMRKKGVRVCEGCPVMEVQPRRLIVKGGVVFEFDECLWCTQASAAEWIGQTGLPTDKAGFLLINEYLQSDGGPPEVFAAGDVASCAAHPRPKAGVFAVRQGPVLWENLRRYLLGQELKQYIPQSTILSIIRVGDKQAVGCKGMMSMKGAWAWSYKDYLDRQFMSLYDTDLKFDGPEMSEQEKEENSASWLGLLQTAGPEALLLMAEGKSRCGGCGSKIGSGILRRALARLPLQPEDPDVVVGLDSPDDAALIRGPPPGQLLLQTVDFFRAFWSDPYVFGKVAANHALGDCFAMGGRPKTALAMAVLTQGTDSKMEEDLFQMMSGAEEVLTQAACTIVGGHTAEGPEMCLGFSITGHVTEGLAMLKSGLRPQQVLIITKPLGTGTILAAAMKGGAKGRWVAAALRCMQQRNDQAAAVLREHGCTGCTDVTGYGVLNHLAEMTTASAVSAELDLGSLPVLDGALQCIQAGYLSSLHAQNVRTAYSFPNMAEVQQCPQWPILTDPQTAGGLLGGVPLPRVEACLTALREAGCLFAAIVGRVLGPSPKGTSYVTINTT